MPQAPIARLSLAVLIFVPVIAVAADQVKSPDGKVAIDFVLQTGGAPAYSIGYSGKPIVLESRLGLEPGFTNSFQVVKISSTSHEGEWTNRFGERRIVPDHYRELKVDLKHESGRWVQLVYRAYNEGAAWRYSFPEQETKEFLFTGELTEFRFPDNTYGYEAHGTEGEYRRVMTGAIEPFCERPLTLEYASGLFACLFEAANEHYPRMLLSPLPGTPGSLVTALGGDTSNTPRPNQRHDPNIKLKAGDSTPWRLLVIGEKPGDLLERNHLVLNLNPPLALQDIAWIKPGKAMRDTTLTTTNSKAIIDFAEKAGLQYVSLDWKWYGSEDPVKGDATTVRVPNLDIPEIVRYGREKNVGLIVYVDRRQIKRQRDRLFPLYEQWGIKGVKIGFVDVGPQSETAWITETIQQAAQHHLLLNIHDGYRSTGLSRTWPNLMTVEGIRGNEHMPIAEHNCTLPFTRYIAGPGDYTVCYFDGRLKTTHAHQLAMAVVSFSPLQWIFWYDRPSMYGGEPEIEFFQKAPTVWDDTQVVNGKIGEYATLARRSGDDWFIGTINNSEARQLQIPLRFLTPGRDYTARICADDPSVQTRTKIGIRTRSVNSKTILDVALRASGGQAIWITPALQKTFVHPGLLHSQAELEFVKGKIQGGEEPWKSAYEKFRQSRYASLNWQPHPEPDVVRDLNGRWRGARELGDDALAAYAHALQWCFTGNRSHALKAAEILNAQARSLKSISGHDAKLLAGITGYKFCNAAEIIRHTSSMWPATEQTQFAALLTNVYYPLIRDFFPRANGNWDASMIVTMISIGVFCDDQAIYDRAKDYFLRGSGNGALTNYVLANGQCQESTRDQQHTQLGLGFLADAGEVAWKQGDDLWGACGNRLALGFEYTARYNLGEDVPVTGQKPISPQGRGRFRPIYEKVYRHYHDRLGLEMNYTRQVLEKIRPEGEHWDHVSWGTLLFTGQ